MFQAALMFAIRVRLLLDRKGITMDVVNTDIINFGTMKYMVLSQGTLKSAKIFTFATDSNTRDVVTKFLGPQYSLNSQRETDSFRLRYATIWLRRERQDAEKLKQAGRQATRITNYFIITVYNNKTTVQNKYSKSRYLRDAV